MKRDRSERSLSVRLRDWLYRICGRLPAGDVFLQMVMHGYMRRTWMPVFNTKPEKPLCRL